MVYARYPVNVLFPARLRFQVQVSFWMLSYTLLFVSAIKGPDYPLAGHRNSLMLGFPASLLLGGVCLCLATFWVARIVRRMSRAFGKAQGKWLSLTAVVLFIFPMHFFLIEGCLLYLNGRLDRSRPQSYQTPLDEKFRMDDPAARKGYRGPSPICYFVVRDWKYPSLYIQFAVSRDTYESHHCPKAGACGDMVSVTTQRGFLGFDRIVDVT